MSSLRFFWYNVRMKTQIGVGVAVLSALAAEGKDFDRDELNAMLDKLAASPVPRNTKIFGATCYVVAAPRPEVFEYVCKKCGTHTTYPLSSRQIGNALARYRDGVASLKALGLDIELDESPLCRKCHSAKELNIPTRAKIVAEPTREDEKAQFHWKIGDAVAIKSCDKIFCRVSPIKPDEWWMSAKDISDKGEVLGEHVTIRYSPSPDGIEGTWIGKGIVLDRLPARPGDPEDWVRVQFPDEIRRRWEDRGTSFRTRLLGDFSYEEDDDASFGRFERLAWVINGKRTFVRSTDDIDILKAFLLGKEDVEIGFRHEKEALRSQLRRLRELLGPVSESDGLAPLDDPGDVPVEVDI